MYKRLIAASLLAISIALVGLVVVQVLWIKQTVALREAQFNSGVDNALVNVSERLERVERMGELKQHRSGRRMLRRIEAVREQAREMEALEAAQEEIAFELDAVGADAVEAPQVPSAIPERAPIMDQEEYEELVSDMVRGILSSEFEKGIAERIEPVVLDSLVHAELANAGVEADAQYGVFNEDEEWVPVALDHVHDTSALAGSTHRARLFRHDVTGSAFFLHVLLPSDASPSEGGLWPMLISSIVFIALIGVAFAFAMRTLWKQKKLNDIRNDLVNNLTHELKTPISTIGLACEALADPSMPKTPEQVRSYTTMIRDENKRLGSLVENVLQSAVQDSGKMVIKPVQLDLHAVIQDVVKSSTIQVSRRNGRIDLDLKAEIHSLVGDRIHLTNLLYNLVDNAVKYTEKEPRITIASANDDEGITVRVSDNGIGIAASEQRKIFDKLYRVPTGNLHNAKGFGLGLSYVKSVIDRHKGRIKVESAPGQGSTFIIFLPFEHVSNGQAPRG